MISGLVCVAERVEMGVACTVRTSREQCMSSVETLRLHDFAKSWNQGLRKPKAEDKFRTGHQHLGR